MLLEGSALKNIYKRDLGLKGMWTNILLLIAFVFAKEYSGSKVLLIGRDVRGVWRQRCYKKGLEYFMTVLLQTLSLACCLG